MIVGSDFGQLKYPTAAQFPEGCARTAADGEPQQQARGRSKKSVLAIGLVSRCFCARTERASTCQTQALCADCVFSPLFRARLKQELGGMIRPGRVAGVLVLGGVQKDLCSGPPEEKP